MDRVVHRPRDVGEFTALAWDHLVAHEAEHTIFIGLCVAMRARPAAFADPPPSFAVVGDPGGGAVAAGLRTPPFKQLVSLAADPEAVDALADALRDEDLPGVLGPVDVAARFAAAWTERTGQRAEIEMRERIHRLDRVIPPERPASGRPRHARPTDRELVATWFVAFQREALPEDPPIEDALGMADRWIAGEDRELYLWEESGNAVSMTGAVGPSPNGIRINSVYTPPEHRGRGYASSLVAAVSQEQLDRGRRFCVLFTDLANPTSNRIYRAIGYRPVIDVDAFRFTGAE
jgi:uncharacterized protein